MFLLLYEPLPLRTTRMLGDFADDRVLPHRLGDMQQTRFHLVKLNSTTWFAADHAMVVTAVQIDDATITGWAQELRTDDVGNTWTVVLLAAPAPPDASVTASGIGRLDDATGRLIENPADVMEYMLRLAGRTEIFPQLRAEAAAQGLTVAGSIDESKSIRSWLDEVAYSVGAIWIPSAARLYPRTYVAGDGPVLDLDQFSAENLVPTSDLEDTCDVLRVSYNIDESNGRALQYVELSARPYRFDGISVEVALKWTRTASSAESIGKRMLQRMGGKLYAIALTTTETDLRPCDWTRIVEHPGWPIDDTNPLCMTLAVVVADDQKTSEVTLEHVADLPTVTVTAHSLAVPFEVGGGVDVAITNGTARFTIYDDNGKPLQDALVSLDGAQAKKTDAQGRVFFAITPSEPPKKHQLAVEAPGFSPYILEFFA